MKKMKLMIILSSVFVLSLAVAGCDIGEDPTECVSHVFEVSVNPTYDTTGTLKCKTCVETKELPALKDRNSYYSSTSCEDSYTVTYVYGEQSFDFEQSYYLYEDLNDNEVALRTVIGTFGKIDIANEYNGKKVTKINSDAFEKARTAGWQIRGIRIPNTVTQMDGNVLSGLDWISTSEATTLEFPLHFTISDLFGDNVPDQISYIIFNGGDVIQSNTLLDCSVTGFEIPATVTKIEQDVFKYTEQFSWGTAVYYHGSVSDWCNIEFENEYANPLFDGGTILLKGANDEWKQLDELVIPETVATIKDYTFAGANVGKVVIPNSVKHIGEYAFKNCRYLETVILGKGIQSTGLSPFLDSHQVEDIYFLGSADELKTIRANATTSSGETVFVKWNGRDDYYYSQDADLTNSGYKTWYYDVNGEPNVWDIKYQDYYFGVDKYSHYKTEVEVSDEAWNELVSKKGTAELNALLNDNANVINAFNESASKEEFKSKVEALYADSNANFEIQFGKLGVIDFFTDSRTGSDYNFRAISVEGVFGGYSYNDYKLYLTEVEEGVIIVREQGYIIDINQTMHINK